MSKQQNLQLSVIVTDRFCWTIKRFEEPLDNIKDLLDFRLNNLLAILPLKTSAGMSLLNGLISNLTAEEIEAVANRRRAVTFIIVCLRNTL